MDRVLDVLELRAMQGEGRGLRAGDRRSHGRGDRRQGGREGDHPRRRHDLRRLDRRRLRPRRGAQGGAAMPSDGRSRLVSIAPKEGLVELGVASW